MVAVNLMALVPNWYLPNQIKALSRLQLLPSSCNTSQIQTKIIR
jgi:hypothetical protein